MKYPQIREFADIELYREKTVVVEGICRELNVSAHPAGVIYNGRVHIQLIDNTFYYGYVVLIYGKLQELVSKTCFQWLCSFFNEFHI